MDDIYIVMFAEYTGWGSPDNVFEIFYSLEDAKQFIHQNFTNENKVNYILSKYIEGKID